MLRKSRDDFGSHMFRLAHLSDIHLGPLPRPRRRELLGKRALGYVNWHRNRKSHHQRHVLEAITADLANQPHDHIVVTGDVVNLGLPEEFRLALSWLTSLGTPDQVTVVPGNHDNYVRLRKDPGIQRWANYMRSNDAGQPFIPAGAVTFPFVRRFGDVALVGLSSAIPTAPFVAAGRLGQWQLMALGEILTRLKSEGCFRILCLHHPPVSRRGRWMSGLRDAPAFLDLLAQKGAELVLHGHDHKSDFRQVPGPSGPIPVVGAASASLSHDAGKCPARYHLYEISRQRDEWRCVVTVRGLPPMVGAVQEVDQRTLLPWRAPSRVQASTPLVTVPLETT